MLIKNNPHGGDIYNNKVKFDFSANVSPLGTPKQIVDVIKNSAEKILAYPDAYCSDLRKAIAKKHGISAENIICGNGAADLIFGFALALKPKNAVIVSPTFCEYEHALKTVDCSIDYYMLDEKNDFELNKDFVEILSDEIDVVFICNPNNPTGKFYDTTIIKKIADKCKKLGIMLFIDECFFDLTGHDAKNSAVNLLCNENIVALKAFTKSYGMAGVRLGYLLSENTKLIYQMSVYMQTWNVSTLAQNAGLAAINECEDHIKNSVKTIKKERMFLQSEFDKLKIKYYNSDVNFMLFKSNKDLYELLLSKEILIRKCDNFIGLDKSFYRIAIKNHEENMALIHALKEIYNYG